MAAISAIFVVTHSKFRVESIFRIDARSQLTAKN